MISNTNKISTKIKLIGAFLATLTLGIIISTLYLSEKNEKDALVINIAGKQRMLTQKISKNIFYLYNSNKADFSELDNAVEEFIYNINSLQKGNDLNGISPVPTNEIAQQLSRVLILWNSFYKNIQSFKDLFVLQDSKNDKQLKAIVTSIYSTNTILLNEVDKTVSMYTNYSEEKTQYLQNFQYSAAGILFLVIIYSIYQLKSIESNAKEFLDYSKKIIEFQAQNKPMEPITIEAESEIIEATDTINCFITKINKAYEYSSEAVEKSQQASEKLEEISDEFDQIICDIQDASNISSQLSRSEDIAIQSTEDLIKTTKKLTDLKKQLDSVLLSCQN